MRLHSFRIKTLMIAVAGLGLITGAVTIAEARRAQFLRLYREHALASRNARSRFRSGRYRGVIPNAAA